MRRWNSAFRWWTVLAALVVSPSMACAEEVNDAVAPSESAIPAWTPWPSPMPLSEVTDAPSVQSRLDAYAEWVRQRITEIAGVDPTQQDAATRASVRFINDYARYESRRFADVSTGMMRGPIENLMNAGVMNPVLLALSAWDTWEGRPNLECELNLRRAMVGGLEGQWPAWVHVVLARGMCAVGGNTRAADLLLEGQGELAKWIPVMVCEEPLSWEDTAGVITMFRDIDDSNPDWESWKGVVEQLEACDGGPNPYMRALLLGWLHVEMAWEARTSRWAHAVAEEQWEGFYSHLAKARVHLERAHAMHPELPHAAAQMITVVMGEGAEGGRDARFWFDQAVRAEYDNRWAYSAYAYSLLPRWGGSLEDMRAFAMECYGTGRFETGVPFRALLVLDTMAKDLEYDFSILSEDEEFRDAMIDLCERDIQRRRLTGWSNPESARLVAMLWWAEEYERLYERLSQQSWLVGGEAADQRQWRLLESEVKTDAVLRGMHAEVRTAIDASTALLRKRDYDGALALVEGVVTPEFLRPLKLGMPQKKRLEIAVADRVALIRALRGARTGGDIPLTTDPSGAGWRVLWGELDESKNAPEGMVTTKSRSDIAMAFHGQDIGTRLRLRGRINVSKLWTSENVPATVYLLVNPWYKRFALVVDFIPKSQSIRVCLFGTDGEERILAAAIPEEFAFEIVVWDGELAICIDDGKWMLVELPEFGANSRPGPYVGIGSSWTWSGDAGFTDLTARVLEERPAELGP